jgi:hypothetical protein
MIGMTTYVRYMPEDRRLDLASALWTARFAGHELEPRCRAARRWSVSWPTAVAWGDIALGAGVLATAVTLIAAAAAVLLASLTIISS